jgi:hypothetical protein
MPLTTQSPSPGDVSTLLQQWKDLVASPAFPPVTIRQVEICDNADPSGPTLAIPENYTLEECVAFIRGAVSALGGDPDTAYPVAREGMLEVGNAEQPLTLTHTIIYTVR